jgi:uncharacterized membrane protein YkvA (DUF1232 family)
LPQRRPNFMIQKKLSNTAVRSIARFLARHPKVMFAAAILYLLSPVDLAPEILMGPIGFADDLFVLLLPFLIREFVRQLDGSSPQPPQDDHYDTTAE